MGDSERLAGKPASDYDTLRTLEVQYPVFLSLNSPQTIVDYLGREAVLEFEWDRTKFKGGRLIMEALMKDARIIVYDDRGWFHSDMWFETRSTSPVLVSKDVTHIVEGQDWRKYRMYLASDYPGRAVYMARFVYRTN